MQFILRENTDIKTNFNLRLLMEDLNLWRPSNPTIPSANGQMTANVRFTNSSRIEAI